jgi:nucleoside-diphosphate-sugar epimerase
MRIAVIGASGVVGRAFVAAARGAGLALVTQRADLLNVDALAGSLRGCSAVLNLASSIPTPLGRGSWPMNDRLRREGFANLLSACARTGVATVVQQSVAMLHSAADDRPQTEDDPLRGDGVLASALDMENLARSSTLDVRMVRGGLLYGADTGRTEGWLADVARRDFRVPGDGSQWLSAVHVDDLAGALLSVLMRGQPHRPHIACDDQPLQWARLYAKAARQAGVDVPPAGGPLALKSFRTDNARLRALGWQPRHAVLRSLASPAPLQR